MSEILANLSNIVVPLFAVSSMLLVGFSYTVRQILDPLRNVVGVILALFTNFVLVPLLAYDVAQRLSLDRNLEIGLILVAFAAGAPFVIKLTQLAGGNVAFSAGLLVLLLLATIVYMPFIVPLAVSDVTISPGAIARPLILTMLLPLGIGLLVKALSPSWAERLQPVIGKVTNITLIALVVVTILANLPALWSVFGTGAILAALLVLLGAFGFGYLLGGFGPDTRDEVALGTAQRNYAAAMVVATESFHDSGALIMVVVTSVVSMLLLFPIARALGKRGATGIEAEAVSRREPQPVTWAERRRGRS